MKYFVIICLISFSLAAVCQQTVTIAGEAYAPDGRPRSVTVLSAVKNPVGNEFIYRAHIPVELDNSFNAKVALSKPALLVIHYWAGKSCLVYAIPGDSIHIVFEERAKADTFKSMLLTFNYKERAHYSGSDPARIAFFQRLIDSTGIIDEPPIKMRPDTAGFLMAYKTKVTNLYKRRLKLLDDEANIHHFSPDFKAVAANEIHGQYIYNLMYAAYFSDFWDKYPPGYFDEVENFQVTWEQFKGSRANSAAGFLNINYYNIRRQHPTSEEKLAAAFDNCMRYKDDSVRNFLLTYLLSRNIEKHPANFDEVIEKYQDVCTNPDYVSGVLAQYKPAALGRPLPAEVLESSLKTMDGQLISLKDILHAGKPAFIDFWASWCGPCKREIPMLMQLAEKYKDKIDFHFISIDTKEKEAEWLKAIAGTNFNGHHYLIQDKALIDFARIKSIPRYLVIDKNGNLSTYRGPDLLIDAQGFENTIKAVTDK